VLESALIALRDSFGALHSSATMEASTAEVQL
jgi:hypothetical protein